MILAATEDVIVVANEAMIVMVVAMTELILADVIVASSEAVIAMVVATTEITLAANKVMTVAVVANVLERK